MGLSSGRNSDSRRRRFSAIHSFHFYPYVCVIERHAEPPESLIAPKHGTEWQPFL
jgi:hypothetical protein